MCVPPRPESTSVGLSLQDLTCLFEIYLKPLQKETFLTQDEVGAGGWETPLGLSWELPWLRGNVMCCFTHS